jgi:hypothetical protein
MRANADPQLRMAGTRRVPPAGQSERMIDVKRSCPPMAAESADEDEDENEKSRGNQTSRQCRMDAKRYK